ncbi:MAG: hypothetical protein ACI867_002165 [Glaciecola sp.]|jgi:hypothetical protein
MARTNKPVDEAVVEDSGLGDPETDEFDGSADSSDSEGSSDEDPGEDFEPEDFEDASGDYVDSDDAAETDADTDADTDNHESQVDAPLPEAESSEDEDVPLLLSKDEEFETFDDDDEDLAVEGLREGEFICADCSMVFRLTALADKEAMLCRDCV